MFNNHNHPYKIPDNHNNRFPWIEFLTVVAIALALAILSSGCSIPSKSTLNSIQPKGNRIYPPEPKLFNLEAQEFVLRAPTRTTVTQRPDGYSVTVTEPVMKTMEEVKPDGSRIITSEPCTVKFWVKDQMQKSPTTILDFLSNTARLFAIGYGVNQAFGSINSMSNDIAREPTVINNPAPRTDYVTANADGEINIDRGG